jgi:aryl-alcohol dehydrogenase-like predicted oxidoreductase
VSNFTVGQMKRAPTIAPITSLQPPYAVVRCEIEQKISPFCLSQNSCVIVYSPMYAGPAYGSDDPGASCEFPCRRLAPESARVQTASATRNLRVVEHLRTIAGRDHRGPAEAATAWTLNHPAVTAAIVGFRNPQRVAGIVGAGTFRLNRAEIDEIDEAIKVENAV